MIAEGTTESTYDSEAKRVSIHARLFYSQDAVKWIDLQAVSKEAFARILKNKSLLTGDASTVFTISEDGTATAAEEEAGDDAEGKGAKFTELEVLRARVDAINAATGVVPVGCTVLDALNRVVPNRLFGGVPYPEKLEAYMHRTSPPGGATLAADLRGTWSVQSDPFKSVAICRSLLWPGYFFYYNGHELTWGSMYYGNGIRNNDLVFML